MIKTTVCNDELSLLGFGMMRLPTKQDGKIDESRVREMIAYAIENGVNYFDTAYPYHNGESEIITGKILSDYPRDSYRIASKYPGHQILDSYEPSKIFEEQLEKCGVDYFDYYLLHNINENSIKTYMDPKWGILEYFLEQKRLGKIRHLGFSSHGALDNLKKFLDYCGNEMEFCQIQLNYLDWTLQSAKEKYELLAAHNIPVWVMEPVRGGKLANLPNGSVEMLKQLRPDESVAAWCFRFLQGLPNVKMVLSGMSDMEQMADNIKTFKESKPLDENEKNIILGIAEELKSSVPCTACGYCLDGCPMSLNIPVFLSVYNEIRIAPSTIAAMRIEELSDDKKPSSCISCNACVDICPQNLDIPKHLSDLAERLKTIPSWAEVCKQRAEAAKKLNNKS